MKTIHIFYSVLVSLVFQPILCLAASPKIQESLVVQKTPSSIALLKNHTSELIIDHVKPESLEVYGPQGTAQWLERNRIPFQFQQKLSIEQVSNYPSPEQIETDLQNIAQNFPQITKLFSVGKSSQNRNLWIMKLSRNAGVDDQRPRFKYIANMHGDEIVGRELLMNFIKYLVSNDGHDPRITRLLDQYQIYIMPSMNPDGAAKGTRANARGIDLNRDFPDFSTSDNQNSPSGRAPETQAIMNWQKTMHFSLSANFHGGAEVVNYPWDTIPDKFPQESLVKNLSLEYAGLAPYIHQSTVFENGITNGFDWYEVNGGMQDWSIHWHQDLQLTIELSDSKWPQYSSIQYYFQNNINAMIDLIEKTEKINPSCKL